jgi:hypothetical protein
LRLRRRGPDLNGCGKGGRRLRHRGVDLRRRVSSDSGTEVLRLRRPVRSGRSDPWSGRQSDRYCKGGDEDRLLAARQASASAPSPRRAARREPGRDLPPKEADQQRSQERRQPEAVPGTRVVCGDLDRRCEKSPLEHAPASVPGGNHRGVRSVRGCRRCTAAGLAGRPWVGHKPGRLPFGRRPGRGSVAAATNASASQVCRRHSRQTSLALLRLRVRGRARRRRKDRERRRPLRSRSRGLSRLRHRLVDGARRLYGRLGRRRL